MRFMHSLNAQAVDNDPEVEVTFTNNVSGDGTTEFNADWIEVTNGGANPLYANPYGSMAVYAGVLIPAGKTYRFEWGPETPSARDKAGFPSVFLLGTAGGTTANVSAGAE